MLNKEAFINFILGDRGNRSTASTGTKGQQKESAMPEGLEGFGFEDETPVESADAGKVAETSFARRLLEASGFGPAQYLATGEVILGGDPAAQHLPDQVYYWPKSAGRPYQTILFELAQPSDRLLKSALFLPVKGVLEDALTSLVQRTLKGFEIGGEERKADVKQGRQDETLCVVSIRDERSREYDSAQLICFGTVAKVEGSLETFHIREEARFWEPQLAQDHLERLYDRHFKKLASEKWQDAFISGEERKFARKLMEVCQGATANESNIQEAVIDLLEQIALSYGLRKKPGAERRLEATDLPQDHDIGIAEGGGSTRRTNPFRGMTLRDEKNRLLGYIIYCLDSKKDAATLRSHLSANNRFHNVLVVYPNGESTGLELWQGARDLQGKLTKRGAKFEGEGQVVNLLSRFFVVSKALVSNPVQLAQELAYRARYLRGFALRELEKPKAERDKDLVALYQSFHDVFLKNEDADEAKQHDEFADSYAQTLTYGLLSARWISKDVLAAQGERFTLDKATGLLERTSPFFRDLFTQVISRSHDASRDWLLQDITDLLDRIDIDAVFSGVKDDGLLGHDPVMHFYEPFLAAYDAAIKQQRGVFYTPHPVVFYIVRSVHELLQAEFGLADGLADTATWGEMLKRHAGLKLPPLTDEQGEMRAISPDEMFVQILDPATGTATFLVEVIDVIFRHLKAKWEKGGLALMPKLPGIKTGHCREFSEYWNLYVPVALLPRLHGYELMMAAYAIAHLKIGLKLAETGYRFAGTERARIYLTNALEPAADRQMKLSGFDALAREAAAVNEIKRYKRFTVILGNPPYSVYSSNDIPVIRELMEDYKQIGGTPLGEVRIAPLMDDYCKFVRFSDHLVSTSKCGVIGMITNHGFLTGPVFRGMRHNLKSRYSASVLDLHGNYFRGDPARGDTNVFEIRPGVCISVLGRAPQPAPASLTYAELRGLFEDKLQLLSGDEPIAGDKVTPLPPLFVWTRALSGNEEYASYPSVNEMFSVGTLGMMTGKDDFMIAMSKAEMSERISHLSDRRLADQTLREKYELEDCPNWVLQHARAAGFDPKLVLPVNYRPFDIRWTYYHKDCVARPQRRVNDPMIIGKNLALCVPRQLASLPFEHCFVTSHVTEMSLISNKTKEANRVFPLFLDVDHDSLLGVVSNTNLSPGFLHRITAGLGSGGQLSAPLPPEEIFHYAYAVFHSPGYRSRYADFLKIDFPRLPLTGNLELFRALARLGGELVAQHLLESPKLDTPRTKFIGSTKEVTRVGYTDDTVWINASGTKAKTNAGTSGFQGVPEAVWSFHIGGYQVCHKWLKDRNGRTLTEEDIAHYHKIVIALSETIRLMAEIDEVINTHGGWPEAFSGK
jgi:hypothetical protein